MWLHATKKIALYSDNDDIISWEIFAHIDQDGYIKVFHSQEDEESRQKMPHFKCEDCGMEYTWDFIGNSKLRQGFRYSISRRQIVNGKFYCRKCGERVKRSLMSKGFARTRVQIARIADSMNLDVENCEVAGTCEILKAHHDVLKDDPERLKTDFLVKMICGEEKLQRYITKKANGIK